MDRIDRKIIDILQTNARAPLKEIADRVFLSSPAVSEIGRASCRERV